MSSNFELFSPCNKIVGDGDLPPNTVSFTVDLQATGYQFRILFNMADS